MQIYATSPKYTQLYQPRYEWCFFRFSFLSETIILQCAVKFHKIDICKKYANQIYIYINPAL